MGHEADGLGHLPLAKSWASGARPWAASGPITEIIKHNEFEDTYDDPEHPIPSLTHLEVCPILKGDGAKSAIVIADPLASDDHSLNRLLDKIEN